MDELPRAAEMMKGGCNAGDLERATANIQDVLKGAAVINCPIVNSQRPSEDAALDETPPDSLEAMTKQAMDLGRLETRNNILARMWEKAVKSDAELRVKYQVKGLGHEKKLAIRIKWLEGEYAEKVRERELVKHEDITRPEHNTI